MPESDPLARLPLPLTSLPQAIARFCDPKGPAPARAMAAKGLVPVRGVDQVLMLAQLTADEAREVRDAARNTLAGLPEAVFLPACEAPLQAPVLDLLADLFSEHHDALSRIAGNSHTHEYTLERIARNASEALTERIAVNEARLVHAPRVIEALYKNRNTRMSTADRLIEFAARNRLELTGIPAFKDHVEALQGQLIPEPSDEPLPQDQAFSHSLTTDSAEDSEVYEEDASGTEVVKKQFKPLSMQISDMGKSEKLRLAMVGNKGARAILVRDHNRQVAYAAVSSPQMTLPEAAEIAKSKDVSEEILRYIGNKKDFIKNSEVKHNLVFNPKCPVGVSLKFLGHMRADELRKLSRSRNVSPQIRSLAAQWAQRKEKG